MNLNYLDFYQNISKSNVAKSTLTFLNDFSRRDWPDKDEQQRVLNKFSIQSGINHQALKWKSAELLEKDDPDSIEKNAKTLVLKEKAKITLSSAAINLKNIIEELELIKIKILVVVSDNADRDNLTPGQEIKEIKKQLNPDDNTVFEFKVLLNADIHSLTSKLITFEPHILHFTGHGEEEGIYLSEEDSSTSALMSNDVFLNILKYAGNSLHLIFLNSCKSAALADEIHQFKNNVYVIAYNDYIELDLATKISSRFYKQLNETRLFSSAIHLFNSDTEKKKNPHMEKTIQQKLHLKVAPAQVVSSDTYEVEEEVYFNFSQWCSLKLEWLLEKIKTPFYTLKQLLSKEAKQSPTPLQRE